MSLCAAVAGKRHGHIRCTRTSGTTLRCIDIRFIALSRKMFSVIVSGEFMSPLNTTTESVVVWPPATSKKRTARSTARL